MSRAGGGAAEEMKDEVVKKQARRKKRTLNPPKQKHKDDIAPKRRRTTAKENCSDDDSPISIDDDGLEPAPVPRSDNGQPFHHDAVEEHVKHTADERVSFMTQEQLDRAQAFVDTIGKLQVSVERQQLQSNEKDEAFNDLKEKYNQLVLQRQDHSPTAVKNQQEYLQQKMVVLHKKSSQLEHESKILAQENSMLSERVTSLTCQMKENDSHFQDLRKEYAEFRERSEVEKRLSEVLAKEQLASKDEQIRLLKLKLQEVEVQNDTEIGQISECSQLIEELRLQVAGLENQLEAFQILTGIALDSCQIIPLGDTDELRTRMEVQNPKNGKSKLFEPLIM
eukprot:TRINITY_DN23876_c0_g1_i7.p1 TRINITY_DN23876_c0_g1~~TRINITY_DN23876_c0_g1_i7.p1  ORF type:complete len:337 (-),score=85.17 TRINITY_DN23876_c0_g1_i7:512-1522(-)